MGEGEERQLMDTRNSSGDPTSFLSFHCNIMKCVAALPSAPSLLPLLRQKNSFSESLQTITMAAKQTTHNSPLPCN